MLAAALKLAAIGWHVFPLNERGKTPATNRGFYDAAQDELSVRELWRDNPRCNIGIRLGALSDVFVVDTDGPAGEQNLAAMQALNGAFPATPTARTSRGRHYYFRFPGSEVEIKNSAARIAEGVDIKTEGGYVVAPPSIHPSGEIYTWDAGLSPFDVPVAHAPDWLIAKLVALHARERSEPKPYVPPADVYGHTRYGRRALEAECVELATEPEGSRNTRLNGVAFRVGQLVRAGHLVEAMARAEVLVAAGSAGLDERESRRTFESGYTAGYQNPNPNDPDPHILHSLPADKGGDGVSVGPDTSGAPDSGQASDGRVEPAKAILTAHETAESALIHLTDPSRAKMPRTGFPRLDDALGGFPPGTMTTIGGRTGAGKSSLLLAIAMHQAGPRNSGANVGIISCEDSEWVWGARIMATLRKVNPDQFFKQPLSEELVGLAQLAIIEAKQYGVHLAFPIGKPLQHVLRLAREMIEQRGCSVLMVDYLQAISATGQERYTARTDAAQAIKGLCHDKGVALILASQLKRPETGNPFREPNHTDMKDSGDIENMSEAILLLWPESDEENATTVGKVSKVKWSSHRPRFSLERNPNTGAVVGIKEPPSQGQPRRGYGNEYD